MELSKRLLRVSFDMSEAKRMESIVNSSGTLEETSSSTVKRGLRSNRHTYMCLVELSKRLLRVCGCGSVGCIIVA